MSVQEQPLLEEQELQSAWDQDIENEAAERIGTQCTVKSMFDEHPHDVLKFIQTSGVEKLAEFTVEDDIAFGAFNDDPIITFGSDFRWIDAEAEWRARLHATHQTSGGSAQTNPKGWPNLVAVEAYVVTIKDAAGPLDKGLVHHLITQWQAKRCSFAVFTMPAVQSVVIFKWKMFARRLLFIELALYCIWLVSFYVFCAAIKGEDLSLSLRELVSSLEGRLTVIAEAISTAAMLAFLLLEAGSLVAYGRIWMKDPTNVLDLSTYLLQIAVVIMHLGRFWLASDLLTYALAVQCILLNFRLQYFTQVLRPTRISFTTIIREVLSQNWAVFMFVFLSCVAFGSAFHLVFRSESTAPEEFSSFARSVLTCFEHIYGDLEMKTFLNSEDPIFNSLLALSFIIVFGYCLVNLLLGMIINSLDRVMEHEGAKQLCNQARVINELEALLPFWFERKRSEWHPAFVHVLRINPKKLDAIEMDKLWTKHGDFAPVMANERKGGEDEVGKQEESTGGGNGGKNIETKKLVDKLEMVERQLGWQRGALERVCQRLGVEGGEDSGRDKFAINT